MSDSRPLRAVSSLTSEELARQHPRRGVFAADSSLVSVASTILLAEGDPEIASTIAAQLAADGYEPIVARSSQHAHALAEMRPPSLAILGELESPHAALELLARVRDRSCPGNAPRGVAMRADLPVIVLRSGGNELDLLRAFEAGADDFICRPPRYLELRVRMRALLRRAGVHELVQLHTAGLSIDLAARVAHLGPRRLILRRMEYELLAVLASAPERVFPKPELLTRIWGYRSGCNTRTLDSHASRLRRKLAEIDDRHWIVNVRGVGYRLI